MENLYLGTARRTITPKVGTCLYGYQPGLVSTSVNDDLTATVLYFKQGKTQALLISVTLASVREDITNDIFAYSYEKYKIPREHSIMHSIHTHSAPNLTGTYGWGDVDTDYRDEIFIPETLKAIDEAVANAKPAKMAIAHGSSLIGVNRRQLIDGTIHLGQDPEGVFNPKMTILSFIEENGKPILNLIHYGAHATGAGANTEISRDWPGVMIDMLEKESGALTVFFNGPEGDVGPRLANGLTTGVGDINVALRHGAVAGADAISIFKNMGKYTTPRLTAYSSELKLPLSPRIALDFAKEEHKKYAGYTVNFKAQLEKYYRDVIESYENGYDEQDFISIPQNIIKLGDVAIVAFPYELFSEIGMEIDKRSDIPHVLSLSNSNGTMGYFATQNELSRGGYEITMTMTSKIQKYREDADRYIVEGTLENLKMTGE